MKTKVMQVEDVDCEVQIEDASGVETKKFRVDINIYIMILASTCPGSQVVNGKVHMQRGLRVQIEDEDDAG